jgi:hypothetical protein
MAGGFSTWRVRATPFKRAKYTLEKEWMILAEKFPDGLTLRYYAGLWLLGNGRFTESARAEAERHDRVQNEVGDSKNR